MKIAIVDDEKRARDKTIEELKENIEKNDIIELYDSGVKFLNADREYDIVLMDIEMPGMDGFETIAEYKIKFPSAITIILTTHLEVSRKGYLVNAFRYIDKTKMKEELKEAFEKIKQMYARKQEYLLGRDRESMRKIYINEILYIETKTKGIIIHTSDRAYESSQRITEVEKMLELFDFFRCHKSYMANMNVARQIDKDCIYFEGGKKAYISVRKYGEVKRKYIEAKMKFASM